MIRVLGIMPYYKNVLLICTLLLCFQTSSYAKDVTLQWDANTEPDLVGYKIYYDTDSGDPYDGTGAGEGDSSIIVLLGDLADSNNPEYTLTDLADNEVYFFVVTAYDDEPLESGYSNEVSTLCISSPEAGFYVNASNYEAYTVSGTALAGASDIIVKFGGVEIGGPFTADGGGNWSGSCDFSSASEGQASLTAESGGATSSGVTGTYDTIPPNGPSVSGTTPTNDSTPTWTWTSGGGGGNGTYRYKLDDDDLSAGATETAATSYTPGADLPDGSHFLYVQERDAAGNWSESDDFEIEIDTSDVTDPVIQTTSINHTNNTIDITFSESVLNAMVEGNYTFDPELVINTITDLGGNTYRLTMTTSIPSYTVIQVDAPNITDAATNALYTDYINDDDTDAMADDWEAYYGVDDPAGNVDGDGYTNYQEYMDSTNPTDAGSVPDSPEIVEVIPHDGAGIGADDTRVPSDTSFCIRIKDLGGIDCNDKLNCIIFTIDDDDNVPYDVTLDDSSIFKRKKLTDAPNTAENELWAVYHRSKDADHGNGYTSGNTINILVTITDRAGIETQASYSFKVSAIVPDIGDFVLGDSENYQDPYDPNTSGSYDAGTQVNGGDLDGAKILYASAVEVTPRFGPLDEIPGLDLSGVDPVGNAPMNLQPPTMFTIPARIFIPCPGYTDVSGFSIYLYKYNEDMGYMEWVLACDADRNVKPGGEGWMVPDSRENHNDTDPPTIEIKVYHFSGVGLGDDVSGGGSGLGDGGCFIATAAFGSAFEKHVKVLKEFKDVYLLSNRLGLAFVDAYERFSPPAARFIANHDSLRAVVRVALLPVVGVSWMALHAGLWVTLAIMALVPGVIGIVVRRSFVSQRAC